MKLYEVFDFFMDESNDRSWWPVPADNPESIPMLTAGVRLSGRMDECTTGADLADAVDLAMNLLNAGEITRWSWAQERVQVEREMEQWYDEVNAELNQQAEMN